MSESKLDQLVKGAPPPDKIVPIMGITTHPPNLISLTSSLSDPLASLPSSPPQIYLNLLILEASLRAQFLELRARRRQYTFFLTLLGLWNLYFGYALFLAPREDGSGVGGSIYWVIEVTEKVAFMGGIVTGILVWGTGQWERGIRWPRRWVGITNRGLRGFNCKIVVIKGPWWTECISTIWYLVSDGLSLSNSDSSYRFIDRDLHSETEKGSKSGLANIHEDDTPFVAHEEDISPGGDTIKLLLLPKPFSPSFRENWDVYRSEYWERENERRRILLRKLQIRDKQRAQHQPRPSLWSRLRLHTKTSPKDVEKSHHHHHHHHHSHSHAHTHQTNRSTAPDNKRLRPSTANRSNSHSRTSSRSSSPTPELDGGGGLLPRPSSSSRVRRGSNTSTSSTSSSLRKKKPTSPSPFTSSTNPGTGLITTTSTSIANSATVTASATAAPSIANSSPALVQKLLSRGGAAGGGGGGSGSTVTGTGTIPTINTRPHSFIRGNSFSSTSTEGSASASGSGAGSRPVTPAGLGGTATAAAVMGRGREG